MGTIPYLGIFLNDLAMLHESAPDRVSRDKSAELRCPSSGTSLINRTPNHQNHKYSGCQLNNGCLFEYCNRQNHCMEPPAPVPPLSFFESPRRQIRHKRINGSDDSDVPTRHPLAPQIIDRRSRKDKNKSVSLFEFVVVLSLVSGI